MYSIRKIKNNEATEKMSANRKMKFSISRKVFLNVDMSSISGK